MAAKLKVYFDGPRWYSQPAQAWAPRERQLPTLLKHLPQSMISHFSICSNGKVQPYDRLNEAIAVASRDPKATRLIAVGIGELTGDEGIAEALARHAEMIEQNGDRLREKF